MKAEIVFLGFYYSEKETSVFFPLNEYPQKHFLASKNTKKFSNCSIIYFPKCFLLKGIDWGGLRREWIELICAALFEPKGGLFTTFHDKRQALVHPNPNRPSHLKLKYYEFAGKIVGKCLYGKLSLRVIRAFILISVL